jgi:uncharacterized protein
LPNPTIEPPVEDQLPFHTEIDAELVTLKLGVDACELHGSLCGYLSGGGRASPADWLQRLALDVAASDVPAADSALQRLFDATRAEFDDDELGFELLLPDDEAPLEQRADALISWCRGFLGGFGLASGEHPPLSPESAEALEDLGKIAGSALAYDDPEADEDALAEVSEYVRVAALLLHGDCNRRGGAARVH